MSASDGGLRLEIGRATVAAGDTKAVRAAIAEANRRARQPGVPDAFNPRIVDPAKAEALVKALLTPPGDALAPLAGRTLILNAYNLRIGTSSPTAVSGFAPPVKLEIDSEHGDSVMARASVPVDCALARERAAEAKRRTEQADRDVRARLGHDGAMPAQLRREAVARAWFDNAAAHASCVPGDAAAAAERDAAERAMHDSIVIGGSME
jgi:hypothetical protein